MRISNCKEIKELAKSLIAGGDWSLRTGKKHECHIEHKSGWKCPIPTSPSDRRAYLNFRSQVRRIAENGWNPNMSFRAA